MQIEKIHKQSIQLTIPIFFILSPALMGSIILAPALMENSSASVSNPHIPPIYVGDSGVDTPSYASLGDGSAAAYATLDGIPRATISGAAKDPFTLVFSRASFEEFVDVVNSTGFTFNIHITGSYSKYGINSFVSFATIIGDLSISPYVIQSDFNLVPLTGGADVSIRFLTNGGKGEFAYGLVLEGLTEGPDSIYDFSHTAEGTITFDAGTTVLGTGSGTSAVFIDGSPDPIIPPAISSLTEVPEPSTSGLIVVSFLTLSGVIWVRKRWGFRLNQNGQFCSKI